MASDQSAEIKRLLDFLVALRNLQSKLDRDLKDEDAWWSKFCCVLDSLGPDCDHLKGCAEKVGRDFCMEEMVALLQAIDALPKGGSDESRQG